MKKIKSTCIIDDDHIFVYGTKRLLKQVDFSETIMVFENGQDAMDELYQMATKGEDLPSLIFLDLNMPVMNGWEFLENFVKIPNNNREKVIIYIISSSVDPRDLERVKTYKIVNDYILKPLSTEDLKGILETAA